MRSRYKLCFPVGAICLSSLVAQAESAPIDYPVCKAKPTSSERKGAQGAFAAGEASFKEADYATAIVYWHDAYRRDCTAHALLRNLATAYELMGDRPAAIHALETFLARQPKDPESPAILRRVENLKEQLTQAPRETPERPVESTTLMPRPVRVEAEAAQPASPVAVEPSDDVTASEGGASLAPWLVAGGGAATAIAGTVVFFTGKAKVADADELCPSRQCPREIADKGNAGRRQQTVGLVVGGVGVAALASGVVWGLFFDDAEPSAAATTALTPRVGLGFAGLEFASRF